MLVYPVPIRFWKLRGGIGIQTVESSVQAFRFTQTSRLSVFEHLANNQHNLNMEKNKIHWLWRFWETNVGGRALHASQSFCWDVVEQPCHLLPACTEKPIWNHRKIFHNLPLATTTLCWTTECFCKMVEFLKFFFSHFFCHMTIFVEPFTFLFAKFRPSWREFCVFFFGAGARAEIFPHKNGMIFDGVENTVCWIFHVLRNLPPNNSGQKPFQVSFRKLSGLGSLGLIFGESRCAWSIFRETNGLL